MLEKLKNLPLKNFLYFLTPTLKFLWKKTCSEKISYISRNGISDPKIKKVLIFSQKKFFPYFWKWNFPARRLKNFRRELSELDKTKKKHSEKISYIFRKWIFLAPKLKNSYTFSKKKSYISGRTSKSPKTKIFSTSPKKVINKFF